MILPVFFSIGVTAFGSLFSGNLLGVTVFGEVTAVVCFCGVLLLVEEEEDDEIVVGGVETSFWADSRDNPITIKNPINPTCNVTTNKFIFIHVRIQKVIHV